MSYRGLSRPTPRSRDPSPDKSYNYSRLYPSRPYTRSTSRELEPSTIPKYSGRSSLTKEDVLTRRSSISREDLSSISSVSKYGGRSSITKDDIPRYTGRSSLTKDDLTGSQKYINSRFLPKNTIEKSYTAYSRPSTVRSHETLRKNRELLNVLHAQQEQERASRPTSRCSSVADDFNVKSPQLTPPKEETEMESVNTVTRGTSPNPTTTNIRARRSEIAKTVEKELTRPKNRTMTDKEIQSDRLDDSTKSSRFSGASRMTSTPWSSILDMKFSSPNDKKNLSRTNSNKSLAEKKSPPKIKSPSPKKSLPPQIPKSDSSKSSLHSITTTNKDFRKSVLNMSIDKKKIGRRSNSGSSAESEPEVQQSETTDISENLSSCMSFHKSGSASMLPKVRSRRSPSSDASTTSSSVAEEDKKNEEVKPPPSPRVKSEAEAKSFLMRALAPVTNFFKNSKYQGKC